MYVVSGRKRNARHDHRERGGRGLGLQTQTRCLHSVCSGHEPDGCGYAGCNEHPAMTFGDFNNQSDSAEDDQDFDDGALSHDRLRVCRVLATDGWEEISMIRLCAGLRCISRQLVSGRRIWLPVDRSTEETGLPNQTSANTAPLLKITKPSTRKVRIRAWRSSDWRITAFSLISASLVLVDSLSSWHPARDNMRTSIIRLRIRRPSFQSRPKVDCTVTTPCTRF